MIFYYNTLEILWDYTFREKNKGPNILVNKHISDHLETGTDNIYNLFKNWIVPGTGGAYL